MWAATGGTAYPAFSARFRITGTTKEAMTM